MCGVAGFISESTVKPQDKISLEKMLGAISHRGPDSSGTWHSNSGRVSLGHTRLAIQDLSTNGGQPMASCSGNLTISYNGEIYNRDELESALAPSCRRGRRGSSDTETLLCAIETFGIRAALERVRGMFAFALYDNALNRLYLARDRFGEKPMYYGTQGGVFLFASELGAVTRHPSFLHEIDRHALFEYFRFGYVPSPYSIYRGMAKLPPGHFLTVEIGKSGEDLRLQTTQYWEYSKILMEQGGRFQNQLSVASLHSVLRSVVADQMVSDVPVGTFLSGGIDSSLITALAQEVSSAPIRSFTIGSESSILDESRHARKVSELLGTDHTELIVTDSEVREILPTMGKVYSEPFADSSQIPTYMVSKMARQEVTVVLTGDGGDELFGGYNRYGNGLRVWHALKTFPKPLRMKLQRKLSVSELGKPSILREVLLDRAPMLGVANLENKLEKLSSLLLTDSLEDYYSTLTEKWDATPLKVDVKSTDLSLVKHPSIATPLNSARLLMLWDSLAYLPDDILVKVDRASMASSLETRAPFLDLKVAEAAASFDVSSLIIGSSGKAPLRQILGTYLPDEAINRPKLGFGIPLGDWLRGPLKTWAKHLTRPEILERQGFLDYRAIQRVWSQLEQGSNVAEEKLWCAVVFQLWLSENPKAH